MEPWRPEYAPQAISSSRHPASTMVAFVLAAGFGLTIGGAFASQAGILPPLGGTDTAAVVDQSPDVSANPEPDPALVDVTPSPTDVPAIDPVTGTDPVVIPPPAGGGSDDDDDESEDEDHDEDEDGDDDDDESEDEDHDEDEDGDDD
jgi:hypothetical protein